MSLKSLVYQGIKWVDIIQLANVLIYKTNSQTLSWLYLKEMKFLCGRTYIHSHRGRGNAPDSLHWVSSGPGGLLNLFFQGQLGDQLIAPLKSSHSSSSEQQSNSVLFPQFLWFYFLKDSDKVNNKLIIRISKKR